MSLALIYWFVASGVFCGIWKSPAFDSFRKESAMGHCAMSVLASLAWPALVGALIVRRLEDDE